jgi:hypothetical protein
VPAVLRLIISWAAGLAAYAGAVVGVRGEVLSLNNWTAIGSVTLIAWLVASALVTSPVLRLLASRGSTGSAAPALATAGAVLAVVPVWLTLAVWYGWHPRHLLGVEAGLLGLHYATSGVVLGLSLAWTGATRATRHR